MKKIFYFFLLLILLSCAACANIGALTGGAKDTTPPKIVDKKSTPNLQTNFKKQDILLTFDEWVKLEDVFNQVVVSPPLFEQPEVVLKGRTVIFRFAEAEKLRENATYTINFGSAVKDLNESNVATNLRFVFSTGAQIDSLEVSARLVDALTGAPAEETLFMLYDNLEDSVVRTQKPFYFAKTDKNGFAKIQNVRAGTFKVFALKDNDLNYRFNQESEKIGFPAQNLTVGEENKPKMDTVAVKNDSLRRIADSLTASNSDVVIKMFEPEKSVKIQRRETDKFGVAKLIFNQEVRNLPLRFDDVQQKAQIEWSKDTALVWFNSAEETPFNIYFSGETKTDTVRVRPRGRTDFFKKGGLAPLSMPRFFAKHPAKPIVLTFNNPIQSIDNQLFKLTDSLQKTYPLSIERDSTSPRKIRLDAAWQEGMPYELTILPEALTDIFGFKTKDSLSAKVTVQPKKEFGDVILTLEGLDTAKSYVCQLLSGSNNVEAEFFIQNKKMFKQKVPLQQPDEFKVKIIEDTNKNGRWDTGNYDKKTQPERIFLKLATEKLRPSWDLELTVDVSEMK